MAVSVKSLQSNIDTGNTKKISIGNACDPCLDLVSEYLFIYLLNGSYQMGKISWIFFKPTILAPNIYHFVQPPKMRAADLILPCLMKSVSTPLYGFCQSRSSKLLKCLHFHDPDSVVILSVQDILGHCRVHCH